MIRRSHKKSRRGCADCKRRHVKCDESKPDCVNCRTAGLQCSFTEDSALPRGKALRFLNSPIHHSVRSPSNVSTSETVSPSPEQQATEQAVTRSVNLLHMELYHHFMDDKAELLFMGELAISARSNFMVYAVSSPYLMTECLASSALHMSLSDTARSPMLRDVATRLQTEALQIFNGSVKDITADNVIPAFLYSGIMGLHFFCDTFSTPHENLDVFLDRLVQSIKLMRGIRAIIGRWWEFLLNSDISALILDGRKHLEQVDASKYRNETVLQFEQLCDRIGASENLDSSQRETCQDAVKQCILVLVSELEAAAVAENPIPRTVTSWPVLVSAEYVNLLVQRKPEALVILAYYAVLLHRCRRFWVVGNGGPLLFDTVERYLGPKSDPWLIWPKAVIYI